jgi:hypothetical protein
MQGMLYMDRSHDQASFVFKVLNLIQPLKPYKQWCKKVPLAISYDIKRYKNSFYWKGATSIADIKDIHYPGLALHYVKGQWVP